MSSIRQHIDLIESALKELGDANVPFDAESLLNRIAGGGEVTLRDDRGRLCQLTSKMGAIGSKFYFKPLSPAVKFLSLNPSLAMKQSHALETLHVMDKRSAGGIMVEGKLTAAKRDSLDSDEFALPGGRYPIEDKAHARDALSRVSADGSSSQKAKVRGAVRKKYPGIEQSK